MKSIVKPKGVLISACLCWVMLSGGTAEANGNAAESASKELGDSNRSIRRVSVSKSPSKPSVAAVKDSRLGKLRMLRDAYHQWTPPTTRVAWERQAKAIRERVLVSSGLWPMPPKPVLEPVIHSKIDRGDYTVEKVYFASHPGHYVTGILYRPKRITGKIPGVLCPHGHWSNGRFYDAGESTAQGQLDKGAEAFRSGARYPLQARMVGLVRMGCTVFHYDMVGYADSQQIKHRAGFTDAEAALRLQNFLGLQTFNSIRALDFLLSLPEIDSARIGITGASGGGTQTFMLGAVDPRPAVAFPAVMVSTGMQGGCVCENAEYLRIGINNIAITALFAPKPLAMSGADDWTIEIETKGLPELKQVYALYGKPDFVHARAFPQFKHNYNRHSRQLMFDWFKHHLQLESKVPVAGQDFWPLTAEMTVFDEKHPLPDDAKSARQLRDYLTNVSDQQFAELLPTSAADMVEYRRVVGAAARTMLDSGVPGKSQLEISVPERTQSGDVSVTRVTAGRKAAAEAIPIVELRSRQDEPDVVIWIDGAGMSHLFAEDGQPTAEVAELLNAGMTVVSADVFLSGTLSPAADDDQVLKVNETYQGYTFGYNRPILSNRVRDILTIIGVVRNLRNAKRIHLVGTNGAGSWILLARAVIGDRRIGVDRTVVDLDGTSLSRVKTTSDMSFLPGALKYGGIGGLAALAAPAPLVVAGSVGIPEHELQPLHAAYKATHGKLKLQRVGFTAAEVVASLLR